MQANSFGQWLVGGNNLTGNQIFGLTANGNINFITTNTTQMTLTSGGYLGIGITSPNNYLQVKNLINFDDSKYNTFIGSSAGNSNNYSYNSFFGYNSGLNNSVNGWSIALDEACTS